jgi:hypothetical protein
MKSLRSLIPAVEEAQVALVIRRITIAVLAAFLVGAVLAVPASSKGGPQAVAAKKAKKCKKKKGKKKKGCKKGSTSSLGLPGQATPSSPKQPDPPTTPPTLHVASVGVTPGTVLAGNPTTGQVTVDVAAPSGGQRVDLQSDSGRVSVPGSVVVAPAQKTASFPVTTTLGGPATATLTASIDTSTATTQVKVVDKPSVSSVKLQRKCFTPGPWPSNRVTLDIPAPSDTVVSLSSDTPLSLAPTNPTVTVPLGSTTAFFGVDAFAVDAPLVTVSAAASLTPAATATASVSSTDPATEAEGATLNPDTVRQGEDSTGTLKLTCEAPSGGTPVTFSSSDSSSVGVPADGTVIVPQGESSVDFTVTTAPDAGDGPYDISVTAGAQTVHATLTLNSTLPT